MPKKFLLTFFIAFYMHPALAVQNKTMTWTEINIPPKVTLSSQMDAGLPLGCQLTVMLYSLKFGPDSWRARYSSLPGVNDVEKIRYLATYFATLPSRIDPTQPAFGEDSGTNIYDLPWMYNTLLPDEVAMKVENLHNILGGNTLGLRMLQQFYDQVSEKLKMNSPILAQVYFPKPNLTHAVLTFGISEVNIDQEEISIRVIDPMTGKASQATLRSELSVFGNSSVEGLSFFDRDVIDKKGILLAIIR